MKLLLTWSFRYVIPPLVSLLGLLILWQAIIEIFSIRPILLPSPLAVASVFGEKYQQITSATLFTALAATSGFVASVCLGTLIAFTFSQSSLVRRSFYPYAIFLQTVPIVSIAPMIIIWLDEGLQAVICIALIISLFPIITNTTMGLINVPSGLYDLFRLNRASRWQILVKLQIPHALPHFVTGAKISSGAAVLGAIVGEFFAGYTEKQKGIGYWIFHTRDHSQAEMFAFIFVSTLLGVLIFGTVSLLGDKLLLYWCDPVIDRQRSAIGHDSSGTPRV